MSYYQVGVKIETELSTIISQRAGVWNTTEYYFIHRPMSKCLFIFNFLMLHPLQASQEGFSIKQQVSRICPQHEKSLVQNIPRALECERKCGEKSSNFCLKKVGDSLAQPPRLPKAVTKYSLCISHETIRLYIMVCCWLLVDSRSIRGT